MSRGRPKQTVENEFSEEVASMSKEALKEKLVDISKYVKELEEAKKEDTDLQAILEQKAVAEEPYKSAFKGARLKINFLLEILATKG